MSWKIDKTIEFCYGHRVWTQKLNGEYADDLKCACRHLHGHEGKVQIFMESETLDSTGMVTDFRHLEWFKKFVNKIVDHRFIIDINDPIFTVITTRSPKVADFNMIPVFVPDTSFLAGYEFNMEGVGYGPEYEHIESFFIVDFVPTSENLSRWAADIVQSKMSAIGVNVTQVDWWETPKSRSSYINK